MNIYLIRHGEAEPAGSNLTDYERKLTAEGRMILENSIQLWKKFIEEIDYVISSPLRRAVETAEIIHSKFQVINPVIKDKSMLNGGETKDILTLIKSLGCKSPALIGHQPDLSYHLSILISNKEFESKFNPGSIAKVSFRNTISPGKAVLEFLIPPVEKKNRLHKLVLTAASFRT